MSRDSIRYFHVAMLTSDKVGALSDAAFRLYVKAILKADLRGDRAGVINTRQAGTVARWSNLDKSTVAAAAAELVEAGLWLTGPDLAVDNHGTPVEFRIKDFADWQAEPTDEAEYAPRPDVIVVADAKDLRTRLASRMDKEALETGDVNYEALIARMPGVIAKYTACPDTPEHDPDRCDRPYCQATLKGLGTGYSLYTTLLNHAAETKLEKHPRGTKAYNDRANALRELQTTYGPAQVLAAIREAARSGKPATAYAAGILRHSGIPIKKGTAA